MASMTAALVTSRPFDVPTAVTINGFSVDPLNVCTFSKKGVPVDVEATFSPNVKAEVDAEVNDQFQT